MILSILVGIVDHCRQGRGFTAAGRTRDQDQPFFQHGRPRQDPRPSALFSRQNFAGDLSEYRSDAVLVIEEVGAKSGEPWNFIAEIHVARGFEQVFLRPRCDLEQHVVESLRGENSLPGESLQLAMDTKCRWLT